jgi:hypothetical protein
MDLKTYLQKSGMGNGFTLADKAMIRHISVGGMSGLAVTHLALPGRADTNEPLVPAGEAESERRSNWLAALFLPGTHNVIADLIPDNHIVRRVVVSQLSDITQSLTPNSQLYSDIPSILHFRPGPEASADMFDLWQLSTSYHTQNIVWVVLEGQNDPIHPYWAMCLRSFCEQNNIPFFFMTWGKWLCKPIFARPEIFRELGVLCIKWVYEGAAEGVEANWLEWGTFDFEGRFYSETTTWNGRQLSPLDEYEAIFFVTDKPEQVRFIWSMEKGEPNYCLEFPK